MSLHVFTSEGIDLENPHASPARTAILSYTHQGLKIILFDELRNKALRAKGGTTRVLRQKLPPRAITPTFAHADSSIGPFLFQ